VIILQFFSKCDKHPELTLKTSESSEKWIPRNIGIKQKHLPSFLIIGAAKCGTGALQKYLEYHPQIQRSIPWEVHYFEHNADKPLDWYREQMPLTHAEVLTFEKSAGYLYSKNAAIKAANDLPGVKVLALICDPVDRAFSAYLEYEKDLEYSNFDEYLSENIDDAKKCILEEGRNCHDVEFKNLADMHENLLHSKAKDFRVLFQSLYEPGLTYWKESLEPGKLLILNQTDLMYKTAETILKVQDFLNLEPLISKQNFQVNEETGFACFVENGQEKMSCIGKNKSRSRSKNGVKMSQNARSKLEKFYSEIIDFNKNHVFE